MRLQERETVKNLGNCETMFIFSLLIVLVSSTSSSSVPDPFDRVLSVGDVDDSVEILKHLLCRSVNRKENCDVEKIDNRFTNETKTDLSTFQREHHLKSDGKLNTKSANVLLSLYGEDGYVDDGKSAREIGEYMYKILIPVHTNRSIETNGTFLDSENNIMFRFPVRTKGHESWNGKGITAPWPDYNSTGVGLNQFTHEGMTVTGLTEIDLNTKEGNSTLYGPYPITRFVRGLKGNAAFLVPNIRNGILIHTGEWPDWHPGKQMPNSAGCVHTYPSYVKRIWQTAVSLGAVVRNNTNGKLPYPYKPQGVVSVFHVNN